MLALETITVKGFKSISSLETLDLRAINVVIGPNGSGKSNFIGVFSFLNTLRRGHLHDFVAKSGGAGRLLHFGAKQTPKMIIEVAFTGKVNGYRIELEASALDELVPTTELVSYGQEGTYGRTYTKSLAPTRTEAGISNPEDSKIAAYVAGHLDRWRVYHFHDTGPASSMKRIGDVGDNRALRSDGSNLAAFLFRLKQTHPEAYQTIRSTLQRDAPFFDDFVLEPLEVNRDTIRLEWKHKNSDAYFDASSLSDGTLRFMALATLFLQPVELRPSVFLVDEPELGLHPFAITLLSSLIKSVSNATQVVVSTQSSLLLDHFEPGDMLVAERASGGTRFVRLDPEPFEKWLETCSLGQLWEKNEIGGRPTAER